MKRKYTELKLAIVEKEIRELESRQTSVEVNLRKQKEKRWELISALEEMEATE